MKVTPLRPLNAQELESMGLQWHTDLDSTPYIEPEMVEVSQAECEAFYDAGNELYEMFCEAGEYVIKNNLFFELDIPVSLIPMIKQSWEDEVHWHLYGRFDFAGGIDGKPIKLLEFNADTPTMLYESAVIQWAMLKANHLDENAQFNNIYQALADNFKRMITLGDDISRFDEMYEGWKILFSSVSGNAEEERTTLYLKEIAQSVGFETEFAYIQDISFSETQGVFYNDENYEFLFKLLPWESIAIDEPELAMLMRGIIDNKAGIFLNPAYTILFQSKRMLKILWDLFPNHPLLLRASFEPLPNTQQVQKVSFGREGANVSILNPQGVALAQNNGSYENFKSVYQEFYELNTHNGMYYQPNVFFAYESCGLGFRKGGLILDNYSKFVSHIIR
ncbi:Glutathionylspermidine synthase like protein [Helicobacter fennelliae]|uniref:Similarity with glutathionylspermidine synthase, group 2 n=2 Tax=Helicobacter fennelliae TaxID=215 RepID=T1CRU7_9HELI|nr:glutathionylspermidine synthase family protein [Helicobacter fennelliae]GAD19479.1 similarity with glutathionylspermidine synthase, group 2 [Helicobacter fennelliae MRY12-0050]SQB98432.1 Glutathionylspermidine synthase like protein [Helicobacter fennelliae]STP07794.1 Glutathionylspermidine synthase like protein [Helicobacter fennelliae]